MPRNIKRRDFLKAASLAAAAAVLPRGAQAVEKPSRPNIVFINMDDLGWKDVAFIGSKFYETPNIDKLAREGMIFTNAYSNAANCAPSRACVMSGQYGPRHGVYTVGSSARGSAKTRKLIPIKNRTDLPDDNVTLAEAVKPAGYISATMGKWHLGSDPKTQGFDVNVAGGTAGSPRSYFSPYRNRTLPDGPKGEHLPHRLTTEAMKFVEANKDRPFFLYLPYFSVHTPIQAPKDITAKYKAKGPAGGQGHATYAAMIESADTNIGRLMKKIDALGLRENTIVIFTSDNGGIANISSQAPARAGKGSYYEGGIREPLIVCWPAKIKAGSRCDTPVIGIDFYPTLLEATGARKPEGKLLDGVSLMPLLTQSGRLKDRALFWHFPIYLQKYSSNDGSRDPLFRTRPGCVVRLGDWKLHEYFEDGGLELYNLKDDLGERNNLADKMPDKTKELYAIMLQWRKETKAPVPTEKNPQYDPKATGGGKPKRRKGKKNR
ncbi:MAG: sulfatase [Phycisphaerae bacterium]|jgi:arylsulfatase A-like enzyme|nr:sulfatase [Phycisphaerae bacterium]